LNITLDAEHNVTARLPIVADLATPDNAIERF
jgi:hypothetical protein